MKYKALNYKRVALVLIATFTLSGFQILAKVDRTKEYTFTQKCAKDVQVNFKASDSKVWIESWDKNEILVKATVKVEAKEEEQIDDFLRNIRFEPKGSENVVNIQDAISIKGSSSIHLGKRVRTKVEFKNGTKVSVRNYSIEYVIYMPKNGSLNLKNTYKDVVITDINGDCVFELYSCDLKANNLGNTNLTLKYGSAEIDNIGEGKMSLFESRVKVKSAKNMNISTRYSSIMIHNADIVKLVSFSDKVKFREIKELTADMKYGNLGVDKVNTVDIANAFEVSTIIGSVNSLNVNDSKYSIYEIDKTHHMSVAYSFEDDVEVQSINWLQSKSKYGKFKIHHLHDSIRVSGFETKVYLYKISNAFKNISIDGKYMNLQFNFEENTPYSIETNVKYPDFKYDSNKYSVTNRIEKGENVKLKMQTKASGKKKDIGNISIKGFEIDMALKEI